MNLPFGLATMKEMVQKRKEDEKEINRLEDMLENYQNILESYRKCIIEYLSKMDVKEGQPVDMRNISEIAYLKEKSEITANMIESLNSQLESINNQFVEFKSDIEQKTMDRLENLSSSLAETNSVVSKVDKNVSNRISELLLDFQEQMFFQTQQQLSEMMTTVNKLSKTSKRGQIIKIIMLLLNILAIGMLVFLSLSELGIINITL